jgi:hypothetical protein
MSHLIPCLSRAGTTRRHVRSFSVLGPVPLDDRDESVGLHSSAPLEARWVLGHASHVRTARTHVVLLLLRAMPPSFSYCLHAPFHRKRAHRERSVQRPGGGRGPRVAGRRTGSAARVGELNDEKRTPCRVSSCRALRRRAGTGHADGGPSRAPLESAAWGLRPHPLPQWGGVPDLVELSSFRLGGEVVQITKT